MKDILQRLKELKTERLVSRIKHLRGRHDQRDHNRWPAGYQAQGYIPTGGGRRAGLLSSRATGGLAGLTQTNIMMNQTKRLEPKVKTGTPDPLLAPMPIDASEFLPGGKIYEVVTDISSSEIARKLYFKSVLNSQVSMFELWNIQSDYSNVFFDIDIIDDFQGRMGGFDYYIIDKIRGEILTNPHNWQLAKTHDGRVPSNTYDAGTSLSDDYEKKVENLLKLAKNNYTQKEEYEKRLSENEKKSTYYTSDYLNAYMNENVRTAIETLKKRYNDVMRSKLQLEESKYNYSLNEEDIKSNIAIYEDSMVFFENQLKDAIEIYAKNDKDLSDAMFNQIKEQVKINSEIFILGERIKQIDYELKYRSVSPQDIQAIREMSDITTAIELMGDSENVFSNIFINPSTPNAMFDWFLREFGIDEVKKEFEKFTVHLQEIKNSFEKMKKHFDYNKNSESLEYFNYVSQVLENTLNYVKKIDLDNIEIYENPAIDEFINRSSRTRFMGDFFGSNSVSVIQESLRLIYEMQSYNGKPNVVEWDEIIDPPTDVVKDEKGNPLLFWRTLKGVNWDDPTKQDRGEEYVEQMRTGETHYPGSGVSGYGSYMKTSNYTGNNKDTRGDLPNASDAVGVTPEVIEQIKRQIDILNPMLENINLDNLESFSDFLFYSLDKNDSTNIQSALDMLNKQIRLAINRSTSTQDTVTLKKVFNDINTIIMTAKKGKQYTRNEVLTADAVATRAYYGEYTNGYTINDDARIPMTIANGGNNGNDNHYEIESLDNEIKKFFSETYGDSMGDVSSINMGVLMAILGWDAYPVHVNEYSTNYVILNRAILNMSNRTMGPHYTEDDIRQSIENRKLVK